MNNDNPEFIYQKNVEKTTNKIKLPKRLIDKWGRHIRIKEYEDKLIVEPIKGEE